MCPVLPPSITFFCGGLWGLGRAVVLEALAPARDGAVHTEPAGVVEASGEVDTQKNYSARQGKIRTISFIYFTLLLHFLGGGISNRDTRYPVHGYLIAAE